MKPLIVLALAAASLAPATAGAQSILTQNVVFGPSVTDLTSAKGVTTNAGVLPFFFFDSRVGTLNSISFSSSYQFSSVGTVMDTSATPASGTVAARSAADFSSDDALVTAALNRVINTASTSGTSLSPAAYNIVGSSTSYTLGAGGVTPFGSIGSGSFALVDTNAADLAAFTRTGTFSYNPLITTLTSLVLNNSGGNVSASALTTLTGSLTISYNITPLATGGGGVSAAPEPGTWGMMILGFGLAGAALRRRTARGRVAAA